MYLYTFSLRQASILLPVFLCLPVQILSFDLGRRVIGSNPDDDNCDEAPTLDGPTSLSIGGTGRPAGIGVEFETGQMLFSAENCDKSATQKSKGKLVNNRQGPNWKLTGDSLTGAPGILDAE